jgi:hypothetical protein
MLLRSAWQRVWDCWIWKRHDWDGRLADVPDDESEWKITCRRCGYEVDGVELRRRKLLMTAAEWDEIKDRMP